MPCVKKAKWPAEMPKAFDGTSVQEREIIHADE